MSSTLLLAKVRAILSTAVLSALLAGAHHEAAAAGPDAPLRLRPGLWEMRTRVEGGDAQTARALARSRAQLAALPPEQRARLEQRLAGPGVELQLDSDSLSARLCVTPETAQRDTLAAPVVGRHCTAAPARRDGNSVRFAALCSDPRSTVEGTTTFLGDRSFESTTVNTIEIGGNTRMTTIRQSGRWIGGDCAAPGGAGR